MIANLETAKSQAYKITLTDGFTYTGFVLVNEAEVGTAVLLLYSKYNPATKKQERVNDQDAEWRMVNYNQFVSIEELHAK